MIDDERLKIAREVLVDAVNHDLPASTAVFLNQWAPELLDTLSAALKVVRAVQNGIVDLAQNGADDIAGSDAQVIPQKMVQDLRDALSPFQEKPEKGAEE